MITLSDRAALKLRVLIEQELKDAALRVWVSGGGCSGLSYGMALDDSSPEPEDTVFDCQNVRVVVDALSLTYMDGSVVDYVDEDLGAGFKIENPNAAKSCGCGSSFEGGGGCGGGCGCGSKG